MAGSTGRVAPPVGAAAERAQASSGGGALGGALEFSHHELDALFRLHDDDAGAVVDSLFDTMCEGATMSGAPRSIAGGFGASGPPEGVEDVPPGARRPAPAIKSARHVNVLLFAALPLLDSSTQTHVLARFTELLRARARNAMAVRRAATHHQRDPLL